jgi:hypothetical protein
MRSIALKAALAAMIVTIPLSGAFAGSGAYGDFAQKGWFDGIDSFHSYRTPLGAKYFAHRHEVNKNKDMSKK